MSDVDSNLLEALGNLLGIDTTDNPPEDPLTQDDDFIQRLERAERLANGLDC